jgi:hypothetical protein
MKGVLLSKIIYICIYVYITASTNKIRIVAGIYKKPKKKRKKKETGNSEIELLNRNELDHWDF